MSAVTFAIAGRPGLDEDEARELAELLRLDRNVPVVQLAGKILQQAGLHPHRPPTSNDIELDRDEMLQITKVFSDGPDFLKVERYANLNRCITDELSGR